MAALWLYAQGGILAPSQGQGHMKVQTLAKVLGRSNDPAVSSGERYKIEDESAALKQQTKRTPMGK